MNVVTFSNRNSIWFLNFEKCLLIKILLKKKIPFKLNKSMNDFCIPLKKKLLTTQMILYFKKRLKQQQQNLLQFIFHP